MRVLSKCCVIVEGFVHIVAVNNKVYLDCKVTQQIVWKGEI